MRDKDKSPVFLRVVMLCIVSAVSNYPVLSPAPAPSLQTSEPGE